MREATCSCTANSSMKDRHAHARASPTAICAPSGRRPESPAADRRGLASAMMKAYCRLVVTWMPLAIRKRGHPGAEAVKGDGLHQVEHRQHQGAAAIGRRQDFGQACPAPVRPSMGPRRRQGWPISRATFASSSPDVFSASAAAAVQRQPARAFRHAAPQPPGGQRAQAEPIMATQRQPSKPRGWRLAPGASRSKATTGTTQKMHELVEGKGAAALPAGTSSGNKVSIVTCSSPTPMAAMKRHRSMA